MTHYSISLAPIDFPAFDWQDEPENRFPIRLGRGFPVPEAERLPTIARQRGTRRLIDIVLAGGDTVVSGNFRQAVEEFEPGQHQFFPVTLLKKDGTPHEGDWFILNICGRIPCLIPKGDAKPTWSKYPPTRPYYRMSGLNEPNGSLHHDCPLCQPEY